MAMPQRDETIEEIKRLDALLEYAVMHGDEAEAARLKGRARLPETKPHDVRQATTTQVPWRVVRDCASAGSFYGIIL